MKVGQNTQYVPPITCDARRITCLRVYVGNRSSEVFCFFASQRKRPAERTAYFYWRLRVIYWAGDPRHEGEDCWPHRLVAMAYAYLFKYIIIGDTGERPPISAVLEWMTWWEQRLRVGALPKVSAALPDWQRSFWTGFDDSLGCGVFEAGW